MAKALSDKQVATLKVLADSSAPRSAYPGLSLGSLKALEKRMMVKAQYRIGSIATPQTAILWHITDKGREVFA